MTRTKNLANVFSRKRLSTVCEVALSVQNLFLKTISKGRFTESFYISFESEKITNMELMELHKWFIRGTGFLNQ
jgi:hypothetical protein